MLYSRLSYLLKLLLLLSPMIFSTGMTGNKGTLRYTKTFQWQFEGRTFSFDYEFRKADYSFYRRVPRTYRNYANYTEELLSYRYLDNFVAVFRNTAKKYEFTDWQNVHFVLAFVQSVQYKEEFKSEYPKYPIETLVENEGDCEDTAILLAAILSRLDYDCILVSPPGHMAVAVSCEDCTGTYYSLNDKKYFYMETTDRNWTIGEIPTKYRQSEADLISLNRSPEWKLMVSSANSTQ